MQGFQLIFNRRQPFIVAKLGIDSGNSPLNRLEVILLGSEVMLAVCQLLFQLLGPLVVNGGIEQITEELFLRVAVRIQELAELALRQQDDLPELVTG